jgi:hypothetical protein
MTKQTTRSKRADTESPDSTHQLAQALFKLRLNLKALVAVTDDDNAIARPSGLPIHLTAFHDDALAMVRKAGGSLLRASLEQIMECLRIVPPRGARELASVLKAIRTCLERAAQNFESRSFPNECRIVTSLICAEAYDLCGLAIQNFAINNIRKIKS